MSTRRLHKCARGRIPSTGPATRKKEYRPQNPPAEVVTHARDIRPGPHGGGGARLRPGAAANDGNADPSRAPPRVLLSPAPPAPGRVRPGAIRAEERRLGPPVHDGAPGHPHR